MLKPGMAANFLLAAAVIVSAVAVISVAHKSRALYSEYYRLQINEQNIQDEWGRLQLQEGSESSLHKLGVKAYEDLNMYVPPVTSRVYLK